MSENSGLDKEGLIRDRKIKGGGDTRTYKVSFAKIKKTMPHFKCDWDVQRGIEDMVALFYKISISPKLFKSRKFYRLQKLEDLHADGFITDELLWLKQK